MLQLQYGALLLLDLAYEVLARCRVSLTSYQVFKDLAGTRILLKNLETRLEHSIRRFADYCHYATKDATLLQDMLVKYYGEVIDFAIGVLEEFSHGRISAFLLMISW